MASGAVSYAESGNGEPYILRREALKKRRKLPLRALFQRIPDLLMELKPCLMMSPLSVAHFLSADDYRFDIVIFDEASQVRPHDAIGAIMRGSQLVVAGDPKQLPPTSFFDRSLTGVGSDDDDVQENLKDMESILDALGAKSMRPISLQWHYRSRHESLIAFSNYHMYEGKLITFPTPASGEDPSFGVHLQYVEGGQYSAQSMLGGESERKANPVEVEKVVRLVEEHSRTHPDLSLGVVALGKWHADAIEDAIRERGLLNNQFEQWTLRHTEEPFFVKNLEEVQGDERDVILISIGFAKDEHGVLSHNFGPINQEVGRRRINVLVTRAKNKIIIVSSIRADDIQESKLKTGGGARLLKQYLDYADRGPVSLDSFVKSVGGDFDSPFEAQVAGAVRSLGYEVDAQVGVSGYRIDLGVVDPQAPGRYLLGIECDGATYHSSKTARDRDRLRQEVLEGMGWSIYRIWSTEWFRNREREVVKLEDALGRAVAEQARILAGHSTNGKSPSVEAYEGNHPDTLSPESDENAQVQNEVREEPRNVVETATVAEAYQVASIVRGNTSSELHQASSNQVRNAIRQCVEVEGPIHTDLLVKRLSSAWGYDRAGNRIRSRVETDLAAMVRQGDLSRSGEFLSIEGRRVERARGLDPDGNPRKIEFVAPEELQVAIVYLLHRALSLERNELVIGTARYLGYNRTGKAIRDRLDQEIQNAIAAGWVRVSNGRCELAK